jgi:PAS domain S-box-containing protein
MNTSIALIHSFGQDPDERRHQLFEEAPIAYHEIDTDGVIRDVNRAECHLLGYAPDELIGHHVWEFVAADHRQAARYAIARKISREQQLSVVTREYRRCDGSYIWLEIHERLIENAEGEVVGIRSALLDITERRRFDTEIQRQYDRMRFMLRSWVRAIVTADPLGNVDSMNPAAEKLTGWRQQDALGRRLEEVCSVRQDADEPVDLMSCILAEPVMSSRMRKSVIVDRTGANYEVSWMISSICNDEDVIVGAVLVIEEL